MLRKELAVALAYTWY